VKDSVNSYPLDALAQTGAARIDGYLRITIGTEDECGRLAALLRRLI
jgi:hypothetical protein